MLKLMVNWSDGSNTQASVEVRGSQEERHALLHEGIETLLQSLRELEREHGVCGKGREGNDGREQGVS